MLGTIARRYCFEGKVQGVGFRRVAESEAGAFHVTGYVMNKSDGTVEVHAEGPIQNIDRFTDRIQERFVGKIERFTQELVDPCEFSQFQVAFESSQVEL
jgi:acylphosphatase